MKDIDVWRSANLLIQQHGGSAEWEAARLVERAREKGDAEGERVWVEILKASSVLRNTKPDGQMN